MKEIKVAVLGSGAWGTALAAHLLTVPNKKLNVTVYSRNTELVNSVNLHQVNSRYLADIRLPAGLKASSCLKETLKNCDFLILAVPSVALDSVIKEAASKIPDSCLVISGIKGLSQEGLTPLQLLSQRLGENQPVAVLSGPCFARDLANHKPVGLVAASKELEYAEKVAELFANSVMRVYLSTDPLGVELGGILKNIIAVAAGISDGLDLGDSCRSALITRGLAEMTRLAKALGAEQQTLQGLSGLGDLIMTATSDLSRNRSFGLLVGKGFAIEEISRQKLTVEALSTLPRTIALAKNRSVELPIAATLLRVIGGDISPRAAVKELIERPHKIEFP